MSSDNVPDSADEIQGGIRKTMYVTDRIGNCQNDRFSAFIR